MIKLPLGLARARNDTPMIMDSRNLAHRPGTREGQAACGLPGRPVTLAQAIAWGDGYCRWTACYPAAGGR